MKLVDEPREALKVDTHLLHYWAEEAAIPLFVLTDPEEHIFNNDFLCVYKNNVCSLYYFENSYEGEISEGWAYFNREEGTNEYASESKKLVEKIHTLEKEKLTFNEIMVYLREWNDLYSQSEAVRLKKFERLNTEEFLKKFKPVGNARLQMRSIAETILFKKIDEVINEIARRNAADSDDIFLYTYDEICGLIRDHKKVSTHTITQRSKGYAYMVKEKTKLLYTGKTFEKILEKIQTVTSRDNVRELIGKGVSPGVIKGRVQLILHNDYDLSEQLDLFRDGRILVTEMTRPQLIMICHKVRGIITNEGGILSHAAIVSREFNIPCVVGTEIATHVLKDGDTVELDGNKGTVRILRSAG